RRIRVRPELSLSYPESDITRIDTLPGDPSRFSIEATFLGLYGASSPLPTFYTEDLLHEQSDDRSATRDFLDILNSPLYIVFFKIWSKYRLFHRLVEHPDPDTLLRLFSLVGLAGETTRAQVSDAYGFLRYAGLTTLFPRSAEGLRALLSDRFEEPSLRIEQCASRAAAIPEDQRLLLGLSCNRLGENAYLGAEITDRMGKFMVAIGPAGADAFHRFLPDCPDHTEMSRLIGFYLDQPLSWDVRFTLRGGSIQPACLGGARWSQLGWNTWTFSEHPFGDTVAVTLEGKS
ncbi:MAG: type VI secretion system baseplate subunit TssG, partial [Candidatus Latescibacterota bacterium]